MRFIEFMKQDVDELSLVKKARENGMEVFSADKILKYIDKNTEGHLDYRGIKKEIHDGGNFFVLTVVNPFELDIMDEDLVKANIERRGMKFVAAPIVVGKDGYVIDGRHRTVMAKMANMEEISAYVPIKKFYE